MKFNWGRGTAAKAGIPIAVSWKWGEPRILGPNFNNYCRFGMMQCADVIDCPIY